MPEVSKMKKSQITAYRRKKGVCLQCGRFEPEEVHACLVNYVKADMRGVELTDSDIFEVIMLNQDTEIKLEDPAEDITDDYVETPEKALPELDVRIKTILSYRKRKGLCAYCGKNPHEDDCNEDYTETDLRNDEEKTVEPRTVKTPKKKEPTVLEKLETDEMNKRFLEGQKDPFYKIDKTVDIHTQRPFIMIDITPSDNGQLITFEYVNYIARKYKNKIVFLLGDPTKVWTFTQNRTLEGLHNVSLLRNTIDQNIVNHLHVAKRFFGFPSRYVTYCMTRELPTTTFLNNEEGEFDFLSCDIVSIKDNENVTIETVKRNVVTWRL
jgi:hypothetical protein